MAADLRWIRGTMRVECDCQFTIVDPLASLPDPPQDRERLRTWPRGEERGVVRFTPVEPGLLRFHAVLPRRWGDVGVTPRMLLANGWWYPQVRDRTGLPQADYTVTITLPDDALGALGDSTGGGTLHWSATADRVPLAVVRKGRLSRVSGPGIELALLTRGRPRKRLMKELTTQLGIARPVDSAWSGAVVEGRLRRRLVRSGPGLAFVSDRAYRLTPPLQRVHRIAVTRGILTSLQPQADPFERELAAAGLSRQHAEGLSGPSARRLLKIGAWIPTIDALLNDRTMPFVGEVLEDVHPGDVVKDDLAEVFRPHTPGTVVAAQLDATYGPGTSWQVASRMAAGTSVDDAIAAAGVDPDWLDAWRGPYPEQDIQLTVGTRPAPYIRIDRIAPDDAPAETIPLLIGDERTDWKAGPGADSLPLPLLTLPDRVVVDPDRIVGQTTRLGDSWPRPYTLTAAAGLSAINLSRLYIEGSGSLWLRRRYDTRNTWSGHVFTDQTNTVGVRLGYAHKFGPPVTGLAHTHRVSTGITTTLLNPRFADFDGTAAVGTSVGWYFNDNTGGLFPLRGTSGGTSAFAGLVPGTDSTWVGMNVWAGRTQGFGTRHAIASRAGIGTVQTDVPQRKLPLGGPNALRSIQQNAVLTDYRGLLRAEYRWAVLRHANVPMGLLWGTELQLAAGAEAGFGVVDGELVNAEGVTLGINGVGEVLGAEPRILGLTLAWLLHAEGVELKPDPVPELYLRWWLEF